MTIVRAILRRLATARHFGFSQRFLSELELYARLAQGKGGGASSVRREVAAAISLLPKQFQKPFVALDVGANVGSWTGALLDIAPEAHVFAFEPSEAAFGALEARFRNFENVSTINVAVGEEAGKAHLFADHPGSGLASLSPRRLDHFGIEFSHVEEVPVLTLDDWCERKGVTPQLLKMDVEGHEMSVLRGAEKTLNLVQVVQFEFGGANIDTRTYFQDFFYFFRAVGFRIMRLSPRGLVQVPEYREHDESFQTTNYFAVRKD